MSEMIHVSAPDFPERYDDLVRRGRIRPVAFTTDDLWRLPRYETPDDVSPLEVLLTMRDGDDER